MANKNREGAQMILRNCAFFNIYVLNSLWRVLFFKNVFFRIAKLATEEAQEASAATTCSAARIISMLQDQSSLSGMPLGALA